MISSFQDLVAAKFPLLSGKKLLIAVSGGLDSMVLADWIRKSPFEFAIAHCNFKLRGQESDQDENFVKAFADKHQIPFFVTHFDTKAFAADFKLSIQVAARTLRYQWFYELLENQKLDYMLTAHHADDNLETFLINLSRGTGLDGLTGIPAQNEKTIRPLLDFSRAQIQAYAADNQVQWREDSSNASDHYLRNKIRQQVIPALKDLNPSFLETFKNTVAYLEQSQSLADDATRIVYRKVVSDQENAKKIDLEELKQLPNFKAYLFQWLKPFGFKAWDDIFALAGAQSGKQVFSEGFRLLKDRDFLILSPRNPVNENEVYWIEKGQQELDFPLKLQFSGANEQNPSAHTIIFVDAQKLEFPLQLRKWNDGDAFQPSGMQGQSKKVSKFFKDEKFSLIDKENTWLLCSGKNIVWIVGKRQDERFKAGSQTKTILKIALLS